MKLNIGPVLLALVFLAHPLPATCSEATAVVIAPGPTTAAGTGASGNRTLELTWAELVRLLEQHPALQGRRRLLDAAAAAVEAAGAIPNPEFEATLARGSAREGDAARLEWGLALTVPLGWIRSRTAALDQAAADRAASAGEVELTRRRLLDRAAGRFWRLAAGQQRLEVARQLYDQARELVAVARRRVETGAARPLEQLRLEVELQQAANRLELLQSRLQQHRSWLVRWLGLEPNVTPLAVADLEHFPPLPSRDKLLLRLLSNHPELEVLRARKQGRRAAVALERRQRWPELRLTAFTDSELDRQAWGGVLAMQLPLWNFNSAAIDKAEYELAATENELEAVSRELVAGFLALHDACRSGMVQASRYAERILPNARQTAAIVEKTYQLGEASLVELLDTRRLLLQVRSEYLELLSHTQIACARLRIATGE